MAAQCRNVTVVPWQHMAHSQSAPSARQSSHLKLALLGTYCNKILQETPWREVLSGFVDVASFVHVALGRTCSDDLLT